MKIETLINDRNDCSDQKSETLFSDFDPDERIVSFEYLDQDYDPDHRLEYLQIADFQFLFEQSTWQSLNEFEKKEILQHFKEAVATDLELNNIPELGYYYEENPVDFGIYSSADDKISINYFQLDYPENIVKTIAHEMRHCWQTERINLLEDVQNEFDKMLKFNDENYIQPYDNYCAYWNQPMEIDARLYSDHVMSTVFGNLKDEEQKL